jgi:hypothetical protein
MYFNFDEELLKNVNNNNNSSIIILFLKLIYNVPDYDFISNIFSILLILYKDRSALFDKCNNNLTLSNVILHFF